jgi:hypothetical protein
MNTASPRASVGSRTPPLHRPQTTYSQAAKHTTQRKTINDAYRQNLWLQLHWNDDDNDGGDEDDNQSNRGIIQFNDRQMSNLTPRAARGETLAHYRRRCEDELLRRMRVASVTDVSLLLDHCLRSLKRFGAIFAALRSRAWVPSVLGRIVRKIAATPNFRSAPIRSAISKSFAALCMTYRNELGELFVDVLIDRRPPPNYVASLLDYACYYTCDLALVRRWANETSYALPFAGFFAPTSIDAADYSRLFATLARQSRLQFDRMIVAPSFIDKLLAHSNDVDFLFLAQLYITQNRRAAQRVSDQIAESGGETNQFSFDPSLSAANRRRHHYLVAFELLLTLAPLHLPLYLAVELLSWLSPTLAASTSEWQRLVVVTNNIRRAHRERSTAVIQTSTQSKHVKKS